MKCLPKLLSNSFWRCCAIEGCTLWDLSEAGRVDGDIIVEVGRLDNWDPTAGCGGGPESCNEGSSVDNDDWELGGGTVGGNEGLAGELGAAPAEPNELKPKPIDEDTGGNIDAPAEDPKAKLERLDANPPPIPPNPSPWVGKPSWKETRLDKN